MLSNVEMRDPYFGFIVSKESDIAVYECIHKKGFSCLSQYNGSKNFIEVICPNKHISRWLPKKAMIPCNNCKQCWDGRKLTSNERFNEIVSSRNGTIIIPYKKSNTKTTLLGTCGHIFDSKPDSIMSGSWCTICPKNNIDKAKSKFSSILSEKGGESLTPYINSISFLDVKCKNNHVFPTTPSRVIQDMWCPICMRNSPILGKLRFEESVNARKGKLLSDYINNNDKVCIQCRLGHIFYSPPYSINRGSWCRKCANQCPEQARDKFIAAVKMHNGIVLGEYKTVHEKVLIMCELKHSFEMEPNQISRGSWCPRCQNHCPIQAKENFESLVKSRNGLLLSDYINNRTKVNIRCENNHVFSVSYSNAAKGRWCRTCGKSESHGERKIRMFLSSLEIPFEQEVTFDWLPKKRFDFKFSYNGKFFVIEYDGIQHFEYVKFFHDTLDRFEYKQQIDIIKTTEVLKQGFFLIRIAYSDIDILEHIIEENINDTSPTSRLILSDDSIYEWLLNPLRKIFT